MKLKQYDAATPIVEELKKLQIEEIEIKQLIGYVTTYAHNEFPVLNIGTHDLDLTSGEVLLILEARKAIVIEEDIKKLKAKLDQI